MQNGYQFSEGNTATLLCVTSGGNPPPALLFCKMSLSYLITSIKSCLPANVSGPWSNIMWGHVSSSFGRVLLGEAAKFSKTTATVTWTPSAEDDGATVYCTAALYSHSLGRVTNASSNFTLSVRCGSRLFVRPSLFANMFVRPVCSPTCLFAIVNCSPKYVS